jgi:endo-1,4-beta-xylanase
MILKKIPITSPATLFSVGIAAIVFLGSAYIYGQISTESPVMQDTQTVNDTTGLLQGQWDYTPGAHYADGKLLITPLNRAIVNQDGSGGQANPPINLYGTHLEDATDFSITATVQGVKDTASLQLYGQVPIIADEFRIERKSLRLTLSKGSLQLKMWDGTNQEPVVTQTFQLNSPQNSGTVELKITHRNNNLTFYANDIALGNIDAKNIFSDKTVWFGMDGTGTWTLSDLDVHALDGKEVRVADGSSLLVRPLGANALQKLASQVRPGFTIGAAVALGPATADRQYTQVAFGGNFGAITTENALKWQSVHPQPDVYTFQEADALVAMAQKHSMAVHGHTLVFAEANPRWVQSLPVETPADKENVKQVMLNHIATVVGHFKGRVASWDVVNEPLDNDDWGKLRPHIWYKAMGAGYIEEAFHAAHTADPAAQLYINEWGLEMDPERWNTMINLLKDLQSKNVPITGVGFQAHIYQPEDRIDATVLAHRLQELADMGLKSRISEIDVYTSDGSLVQALQYAGVLDACLKQSACVSYTTWGVSDRYDTYKDDDGAIAYGQDFLWNSDMKPTAAVQELQRLLTAK